MEINKINSLVELFFKKYYEKKFVTNETFLRSLKNDKNNFLTWEQVKSKITILSEYLRKNLSKGDRCVLLSENRPEWLIVDIAIMNAGGVTVPLFTTYSEKDYEYILNNCKPKICVVSNIYQYEKIKKFISKETKVISIENINDKVEYSNYMFKKSIITMLSHPIITGGLFLKSTAHLMVLNPFYIEYFYQYNGKGEFLKTQTHQTLIPIRIIYTIIIYGVVFLGFIKSRKSINDELNLFLILSILYVILIGGWLGIPRYFTPALIFMSVYFGNFFGTKNFYLLKKDKTRI